MTQMQTPGTILIVDDNSMSRKKLAAAVRAMGLDYTTASDGQEGLDRLRQGGIDLVLLDIVMPNLDGFDVLGQVHEDARLRDIPILVISSVDQSEEIARALDLGAVDFLPKQIDPPIFRARVAGCLEKRRLRVLELSYLDDVASLTDAARLMRGGQMSPDALHIQDVEDRGDGLGDLARMFSQLARAVHRREKAARLRINLLQGCLLLMIMGLTWGLVPALSKILVAPSTHSPLGIAAWVAVVTLSAVSIVMAFRGVRPQFTRANMRFGMIAGLFAGVLPQVALFWVSPHVPGIILSITLALESLIVFSIAAALRMETPNMTRLTGLLIGLFAVIMVMFTNNTENGPGASLWVLAAVIVPASYAIESILVAAMPEQKDRPPIEFLFFIMLGSSIWGWSGATITGGIINPWTAEQSTVALIASIGIISAISNGSYVLTIRKMGAVFASQYAYFVTIMGVCWSVLLLGERLTFWVVAALLCVLLGMFLVRPKERPVHLLDALRDVPMNGNAKAK